jgi:hypothetical protein
MEGASIYYDSKGYPRRTPLEPKNALPALYWCDACVDELVTWISRCEDEPLPPTARTALALSGKLSYPKDWAGHEELENSKKLLGMAIDEVPRE